MSSSVFFYTFPAVFLLNLLAFGRIFGYSLRYLLYPSLALFVAHNVAALMGGGWLPLVFGWSGASASLALMVYSLWAAIQRKALVLTVRETSRFRQGGFWGENYTSIAFSSFEVPGRRALFVWLLYGATYAVYFVCLLSDMPYMFWMSGIMRVPPHRTASFLLPLSLILYVLALVFAAINMIRFFLDGLDKSDGPSSLQSWPR